MDILNQLLQDKRSPHTRNAYQKDVRDFVATMLGRQLTPEAVTAFLAMDRFEAIALVQRYKAQMIERSLKEATINRRLAALKALVKFARKLGKCAFTLEDVQGERVAKYRDTTGISRESYRSVLEKCERTTLTGKRNYALLRLLWDNALRRGEAVKANVADFDPDTRSLKIYGKGKGTQGDRIGLSKPTTEAMREWLEARGERSAIGFAAPDGFAPLPDAPLFVSLDPVNIGHRLTGSAIYWIVQQACQAAGVGKKMSPHRIRHSSITAALDATDGDVRRVQKLSRHSKLDTLMIYDDNRQEHCSGNFRTTGRFSLTTLR